MKPIPSLILVAIIGLIILWLVAENKWSKRVRITLGIIVLVLCLTLTSVLSIGFTKLDDNSYYAASVGILLDETIAALDAKEEGFLSRLKAFRKSQNLTYEDRSTFLENTRALRDAGKEIRNQDSSNTDTGVGEE